MRRKPTAKKKAARRSTQSRAPRGKMRQRIQEILEAMATGQWNKILSPPAFAKKWSEEDGRPCCLKTVQNYATHAGTLLQVMYDNDEEIRAATLARLDFVAGASIVKGEYRSTIEACRVLLSAADNRTARRETQKALEQAIAGKDGAPRELRIVYAPGIAPLPQGEAVADARQSEKE
jgi:hypothetical protein